MSPSMFLHPFISLFLSSSVHTCLQNKVQHIFIAQCFWAACESVMSTIASSISCFYASPSGHKSTDSFPQICSISLSSHQAISEMKLCSENVNPSPLAANGMLTQTLSRVSSISSQNERNIL